MEDFLHYLKTDGILTQSELDLAVGLDAENVTVGDAVSKYGKGCDVLTLRQAQLLVDAGIKTLNDMDESLFLYRMEFFTAENTIHILNGQSDELFKDSYLDIIEDGFRHVFGIKPEHSAFTPASSLNGEFFIYQHIIGPDGKEFTTGLVMSKLVLKRAAEELYKRFTVELPPYGGTDEDALDLFHEFLNNINGGCTYRFDVSFDLSLPEDMSNAELTAPEMYVAGFQFLDYGINVFLIYGNDYRFSVSR